MGWRSAISRKANVFSVLTYVVASTVLFGDPLGPVDALVIWSNRLNFQYWSGPLLIGLALGAVVSITTLRARWSALAVPLFILTSMATSVGSAVIQIDGARQREIAKFSPDRLFDNSFWRSLHERPREFQFYLHAGAMKNCVPYAWSYRTMSFYQLKPVAAINVLPNSWLEECNIVRAQIIRGR